MRSDLSLFHDVVSFAGCFRPRLWGRMARRQISPRPGRRAAWSVPVKGAMGWGPLFPLDRPAGLITVPLPEGPGGAGLRGGRPRGEEETTGASPLPAGGRVEAGVRNGRSDWSGSLRSRADATRGHRSLQVRHGPVQGERLRLPVLGRIGPQKFLQVVQGQLSRHGCDLAGVAPGPGLAQPDDPDPRGSP